MRRRSGHRLVGDPSIYSSPFPALAERARGGQHCPSLGRPLLPSAPSTDVADAGASHSPPRPGKLRVRLVANSRHYVGEGSIRLALIENLTAPAMETGVALPMSGRKNSVDSFGLRTVSGVARHLPNL